MTTTKQEYVIEANTKIEKLEAENTRLWEALKAVREYSNDGGCWCDTRDFGFEDHSTACTKARAALTTEEKP